MADERGAAAGAPDSTGGDAPVRDYHSVGLTLLLAVFITAQTSGLVALVMTLVPERSWDHLLPLVFLVALEGILTTRWLRRPAQRLLARGRYRIAEYVVVALLLRFLLWGILGMPTVSDLRRLIVQPGVILDGIYLGHVFLFLVPWTQAINLSKIYDDIVIRRSELARHEPGDLRLSGGWEVSASRRDTSRRDRFGDFGRYWLNGGIFLVIMTALTTVDVPNTVSDGLFRGITRLDMRPVVLWGLLIYFILGLWLLSHARLQVLQARWLIGKMDFSQLLGRVWYRSSLVILLGIAFVAAFLPIGSTLPIAYLIQLISNALLGLATILLNIIFLLFTLLLSPFMGGNGSGSDPPLPTLEPLGTPAVATPPPPALETDPVVTGTLFWLVLIVLVVAALLFYLRERGSLKGSSLRAVWADWLAWLAAFWTKVTSGAQAAGDIIRQRLGRDETGKGAPPWRFVRLNALSPRERIRYFYLSTVRRARDKGVPRQPGETPLEYAEDLKQNWPETEADLSALTDAFLQARYSRQEFEEADLNPIKQRWRRVRAGIRQRRQKKKD